VKTQQAGKDSVCVVALAVFSTLEMEAIRSSETSVHTKSTRRHIPEDSNLHFQNCLKDFNCDLYLRTEDEICLAYLIYFVANNLRGF
jgi:hypothetical protein